MSNQTKTCDNCTHYQFYTATGNGVCNALNKYAVVARLTCVTPNTRIYWEKKLPVRKLTTP